MPCGSVVLEKGPPPHHISTEASSLVFVFLPFHLVAPSAPVINPQAPNSATGSSVRVCWSLYSDDTVESYHLSYRPVGDSSPGEGQAGEALQGHTHALGWLRPLPGQGPASLARSADTQKR